jgi:hypothetical protein
MTVVEVSSVARVTLLASSRSITVIGPASRSAAWYGCWRSAGRAGLSRMGLLGTSHRITLCSQRSSWVLTSATLLAASQVLPPPVGTRKQKYGMSAGKPDSGLYTIAAAPQPFGGGGEGNRRRRQFVAGLEIGLDAVEHLLLIDFRCESGHGLHLQRVRGLLEGDALARGAGCPCGWRRRRSLSGRRTSAAHRTPGR